MYLKEKIAFPLLVRKNMGKNKHQRQSNFYILTQINVEEQLCYCFVFVFWILGAGWVYIRISEFQILFKQLNDLTGILMWREWISIYMETPSISFVQTYFIYTASKIICQSYNNYVQYTLVYHLHIVVNTLIMS